MQLAFRLSLPAAALFLLAQLGGCGCGFDCNNNSDTFEPALLTLGLSDALPEDLAKVVIEVDAITFKRSGSADVVVDTFTVSNQTDLETFKIDLLQYPGRSNLVVIDKLALAIGSFDSVDFKILVDSDSHSYVEQRDGTTAEITVANGGVLTLPGMKLTSGPQKFVVEFGLAQALSKATDGRYLLANTGVRMEDTAVDASLSGRVDSDLFNTVPPCDAKTDPTAGNRVYLYQMSTTARNVPADVYTSASTRPVPDTAQAPFAVASLLQNQNTQEWEYAFGYLPAGDYTLAFACNTQSDGSINYDGIVIPQPSSQKYEISLSEGEQEVCNLSTGGTC